MKDITLISFHSIIEYLHSIMEDITLIPFYSIIEGITFFFAEIEDITLIIVVISKNWRNYLFFFFSFFDLPLKVEVDHNKNIQFRVTLKNTQGETPLQKHHMQR